LDAFLDPLGPCALPARLDVPTRERVRSGVLKAKGWLPDVLMPELATSRLYIILRYHIVMPRTRSANQTRTQGGVSAEQVIAGAVVVAGIALGLLVLKYLLEDTDADEE